MDNVNSLNNDEIEKENSSLPVDVEVSYTVWNHFTKTNDKNSAIHTHLKSKHNIIIAKDNIKGIFICPTPHTMCVSYSYCSSTSTVCVQRMFKRIAK